jgi:hypothetical protein
MEMIGPMFVVMVFAGVMATTAVAEKEDFGEHSGNACEAQQLLAVGDFQGDDVNDLCFLKGDVITMTRKDGAGFGFGTMEDGATGWFPLQHVELIHDNAVAEIGTNTGEVRVSFVLLTTSKPI